MLYKSRWLRLSEKLVTSAIATLFFFVVELNLAPDE
jgi:hypothetical protein